eukprot:11129934-Alexandrium_andersonii.AAC.1
MLAVTRSGRNPTMRYVHRAHRMSVYTLRRLVTSTSGLIRATLSISFTLRGFASSSSSAPSISPSPRATSARDRALPLLPA